MLQYGHLYTILDLSVLSVFTVSIKHKHKNSDSVKKKKKIT